MRNSIAWQEEKTKELWCCFCIINENILIKRDICYSKREDSGEVDELASLGVAREKIMIVNDTVVLVIILNDIVVLVS